MDAAFCQRDVFRLLAARRCAYAIKVGYWSWLPLKALAAARQRWEPLALDVAGFMTDLAIPQWNLHLRVMLYRKHVQHETPKNFQLDLFTPDDGHFEYYAVATNMALGLPALYAFVCGRGVQEKTFGELKGEFALDVVPTRHYGANSAWQQLSILAHNVARSFQFDTFARPSRARASGPTPTCSAACERCASCSSRGRAVSRASTGATSCAWRPTPPPNSSMREWPMLWQPDLFSDWG